MMRPPDKIWKIANPITGEVDRELVEYHPILRQILFNRGYTSAETARQFIQVLPPDGTNPENLSGMLVAVDRIMTAIHDQEPIVIYGDYDADGVTATALLVQAFRQLNAKVMGYIPNRFDEGYGLNIEALTSLHQEGAHLVITVDCGIRSIIEADHARSLGLDLIITDHHYPGDEIPSALAVINPKLPSDPYPDKNLAGVGLAYKLAQAVFRQAGLADSCVEEFLDLVALGTVTDLAPLVGENRYLVKAGLNHIRRPQHQGLLSLIGVSGLNPAQVTSGDIAYMLGPRLNAAGRLESALAAFDLLNTSDPVQAARLAQTLNNQNIERQKITREIQARADEIAFMKNDNPILLFAADPEFNPGVVGLAASRLTEQYYRPAIIASVGEELTRGSCRSIPEFHITQALDMCADLLQHYGGHAAAAGFTVKNNRLPEFIDRMSQIAADQLGDVDLRPVLQADAEVDLIEIRPEFLRTLTALQPTGMGNRSALFLTRKALVRVQRTVGKETSHLKLVLVDSQAVTHDAIAFRMGHLAGTLPNRVDLMFAFEKNEFNGQEYLQLNVRDIHPSTAS
jgi:single-stranded-DNA-specific exonuclease